MKGLGYISKAIFLVFVFATGLKAQSIEFDKQMGAENAAMVIEQFGIYQDAEKTKYVENVGYRLLENLDDKVFDYQFHIVPSIEPNAFALPGGYIYITTGLLPIIETEDELACILAHEIIHAHNRHAVRQIKKSVIPKLFEIPGNIIGIINHDLGEAFNAPIQASNALLMASYGRDFETESDVEGIKLAAMAGYDPSAMIPILNRMSAAIESATGQSEAKSYFNDHPYTPDRVEKIKRESGKLNWQEQATISNNYLLEFDSLLFGNNPANGVVRGPKFLHPDLNFTITFPEGWSVNNQPSAVGAYHPDKSALILLSLENPKLNPNQAANMFLLGLDPKFREKLVKTEKYSVDGHEGYLVTFEEQTRNQITRAYILYLAVDGNLFRLTGIDVGSSTAELLQTAESLRRLSSDERNSFIIHLVRVSKSSKGETIGDLSKRVDNFLNNELTAIINGKDLSSSLGENEKIKIVKRYPYKPN